MPALSLFLAIPLLWFGVAVAWSPVLYSSRVRSLFGRWPTGRLLVNYPLYVVVVTVVHAAAFLGGAMVLEPEESMPAASALFSTLLVPLVGWAGVVAVLPRVRDVDLPKGVWFPLGLGAVWYAAVVAVSSALFVLVVFLLFYPG